MRRLAVAAVAACAALALFGVGGAAAQPGPVAVTAAQAPAPAAPSVAERTALIEALTAGRLAPNIDPRPLFHFSLARGDPRQWVALLKLVDNPNDLRRGRNRPAELDALPADVAALTLAQARFLTLPAARRAALIGERAAPVVTLADRAQRKAALQALLAGEPTVAEGLDIDLLDPQGPTLDAPRRTAILAALRRQEQARAAAARAAQAQAQEALSAAEDETDALLGKVLALPLPAFADLRTAARLTEESPAQIEARAAAEARERAAREAASAGSEVKRLIATERGRLLAVKAVQARYEAQLQSTLTETAQMTETTLVWRRKVGELQARSGLDPLRRADADALYGELVAVLQQVRGELHDALQAGVAGDREDLTPAPLDEALTSGPMKTAELIALRAQLVGRAAALNTLARRRQADQRAAIHATMVALNALRLSIIDDLSGDLRRGVLGYGAQGAAQVHREADQIALTVAYNIQNLPLVLASAAEPFIHPSPTVFFGLVELAALLGVFAWWRARGPTILRHLERGYATRSRPTLTSTAMASALRFLRRVGRPLDWLVLVLIAWWGKPAWLQIVGFEIVWIIVIWLASAAVLIRAADVLAHGDEGPDPRADLRRRTLRLLAGLVLLVGLSLTVTSASVGKGAIYHWLLNVAWVPAIPVAFLLADWWRERIVILAQAGAARGPILRWAARAPHGLSGALSRLAAGAVLLLQGASSQISYRVRDFTLIREIFDQRARARAAQRAADDQASGRYLPIAEDRFGELDPHRAAADPGAEMAHDPVLETPPFRPGSVQAIIGERGLGKSTALAWWRSTLGEDKAISLRIGDRRLSGLCADLMAALGMESPGGDPGEAIVEALRTVEGGKVVFIDELERLIVPAIGGLADFDRLIDLTHDSGVSVAWVFACDIQAWNYLSRARHERTPFDSIILAPHWESGRIRALIERRTAQAGLDPTFEGLEQLGRLRFDGDLSPEERNRAAYFDALFDYSRGNPAIALEFWRRSLFEDLQTGRIVVRTFAAPDAMALSKLPTSALYVLRTIIQVENAGPALIQRCTDLPAVIVNDALRSLVRAGVIRAEGAGYAVTLYWLREATQALERRNLLSGAPQ